MVLLKNTENLKDLYFVLFNSKDNNILSLKEENNFKGLFFDIVLTSNKDNIPFHLNKTTIKNIIPVEYVLDLYKIFEEKQKEQVVIREKQNIFFNEEEKEKLGLVLTDKIIKKEEVKLLVDFFKLVESKEIEPIYLPNKDKEKELSFLN